MTPHSHCDKCIKLNCRLDSCKIIDCRQGCGSRMHECKHQDHLVICLKVGVPCLNSENGCNIFLVRNELRNHLKRCPASVVSCSFEYNRWPVYTREKRQCKYNDQFKRKVIKDDSSLGSNLNIALARRDQDFLNDLYKYKNIRRVLKNNITKSFVAVPMSPYIGLTKISSEDVTTKDTVIRSNSLATSATNSDEDSDCGKSTPSGLRRSAFEKLANNNIHHDSSEITDSADEIDSTSSASSLNEDVDLLEFHHKVKKSTNRTCKNPDKSSHLIVDLNIEFRANHQTKPKPMYTFRCGSDFRRDEFCSHFQNVHTETMSSLNGWMEKFCPNHQYGCPFFIRRLHPIVNNQRTKIIFSKQNKAFGNLLEDDVKVREEISDGAQITLTDLPVELISRIISHLDGFSLSNLSLTNKFLRLLCCNHLEEKGLVTLIWNKEFKELTNEVNWRVIGYRWKFSNHFSLIRKWELDNDHKLLNHINNDCEYFDRLIRKEPFQLIDIGRR